MAQSSQANTNAIPGVLTAGEQANTYHSTGAVVTTSQPQSVSQIKTDVTKRPIDQAIKQVCVFIGHPVHDLKFDPNHSGAYARWRVAFADAIERRRIDTRSTYGYSPQELFYGFDALTPFSRRFEDVSNTIDEDSVRFKARRRDRERQRMVNSTLNVMEKMRADALSRINPSTYTRQVARRRLFKVSDSVMKWVRNVDPLTPSWRGPLLVQQVPGDSTYKLSDGTVQDSRNMRKYFGKAQNMNPITIAYIQ
ncbi:hypothetical protein Pmar_PMAR012071 [Perkinsus marinus ATCC 50983]|uniref:Uncharacterized protein n=1 Tax=Perkinsus marinus (strain ATCC 50983 / TXsc) TaxID=423536 RepID=C5LV39_PERM5|nr:hypothetical protein Pmar_PMAR012071 [Perkinsus marinus ATCC 50983]EEQ99407.1 hypothetical protein Pmar_PMAR012071 [Perkinsus marinus ATCC 50983]|eukprot:XP_002766690.1 hypothetical protein Pmar_PMAR012071 [Perkinsus marinus ATCC 50983]